jgi:hypothetical protein
MRHSWSKHQQRAENGDDKERNQAYNLQLERHWFFTVIEHAIGNNASQNRALCNKDWTVRVGTLSEET